MNPRTLSPHQLAALTSLVATPARKAKASVTLSGNLLKVIDALAGSSHRSAWIERALRSYARRQLKQQRRTRELELLNRHAKTLNDEGADSAAYQSPWDGE
jgi:metal-responsive CopG/Arc/MetJ family transcriptional regulator